MKNLLQKWEYFNAIAEAKSSEFLTEFAKQHDIPSIVYNVFPKGIKELPITESSVDISGRPYYWGKKPTRKDVQALADWVESFNPAERAVFLSYKYTETWGDGKTSTVSGAVKFSDLNQHNYFTNKSEAESRQKELLEIYGPKEGHIACAYCNKQSPTDKMVSFTIYTKSYPRGQTNKYCSNACGGYDQMAHEG
jgi:hypothetical protein